MGTCCVGSHQPVGQLGHDALCTMMRRVEVQRWPAVPTAPKTMPRTARSRSASSATMMALLPPSSRMVRPRRPATVCGHVTADLHRAGEADQRQALVVEHALAHRPVVADDQVEDAAAARGRP